MKTTNLMITGVGGQGTVLASDIMAAVGVAAGYDVKKSDILGLAIRGGAVISHVRWGQRVQSPIVPEGQADYLVAFEILEGLRWLDQVNGGGTVLLNQQVIHPVAVTSGFATYPDQATIEGALQALAAKVYRVDGLQIARGLGNARVLNVVLLGALAGLLDVEAGIWEGVLRERVPAKYVDLNLKAFRSGREWLQERI